MNKTVEELIEEQNPQAPRVTEELLYNIITDEDYYQFPGTTVTVCCLTLENGFNVIGESAAVSPENFNAEIGRRVAYQNAFNKLWTLEGYLLKETLFQESIPQPIYSEE